MVVTSPPGGYCACLFVCLSVCLSACITRKPRGRTSPIFMHVVCDHGLVLFLRRCDTLCTSGFVDNPSVVSKARRQMRQGRRELGEGITLPAN